MTSRMEWFGNIVRRFTPQPQEPDLSEVAPMLTHVERATAQIRNAWGSRGTAFQVRYNNENLLITSAHLTTNDRGDARGFYSGGRQYFVVVRNGTLAIAEHLIYNPQGSPCVEDEGGNFTSNQPFRDISVLRILDPEDARPVLNSIWANNEGGKGDPERGIPRSPRERMADIIRHTPELQYMMEPDTLAGRGISASEIMLAINDFELGSIALSRPRHPGREPHVTPRGYSLGYFNNRPQYAIGDISRVSSGSGSYHYRMTFNGASPFTRGFSGGPTFDVDEAGRLVMRGINTGVRSNENIAFMTPMQYVYQGLDIATGRDPHTGLPARELATLTRFPVCPVDNGNGPDVWIRPSDTPDVRIIQHPTTDWPDVRTIR